MSKTKSKILLSLFLVLVVVSSCCFATVEPTAEGVDNTAVSEDEHNNETTAPDISSWTNADLFIADDNVTISNVVDGNAFVVGKEVTVTGEIGGDLFVVADKLNIEGGYVYSSIFACVNELNVNGVVYDVYAICNNFNLESTGFIYRDMKLTASNVNINGKVRRNAYISANNITFAESAEPLVLGNLQYSSKSELTIPEGLVGGEVTFSQGRIKGEVSVANVILNYVKNLVTTLFFTFIVTVVLLWLAPKFVERVGNMGVGKSFASLGIGFATPIVLVLASLLLLFSVVGVPVAIFGFIAFFILALTAFSITSIFFGNLFTKLLKMEGKVKFVLFTLASAIVLWLLCLIPIVGREFFSFAISLFGIGTTLVNIVCRKEKVKEEKTAEVKE